MISTGTVDNCWWYGGYGEQKENVREMPAVITE
jgi:uncharacterized protein YodC (DUF2158 family)